jgi:hypothetical protein
MVTIGSSQLLLLPFSRLLSTMEQLNHLLRSDPAPACKCSEQGFSEPLL